MKKGRVPGIYKTWAECEAQVKGFADAIFKGFRTRADAKKFLAQEIAGRPHSATRAEQKKLQVSHRDLELGKGFEERDAISRFARNDDEGRNDDADRVIIYTDGSSVGNPGAGGYAAVMLYGGHRKEARGGFRLTTNNRMEMMAALVGLGLLKRHCAVTIYTDSKYLRDAMMNGWVKRWMKNGWRTRADTPVANMDLWLQLWDHAQKHNVKFEWVRGHAGNAENERCDQLATQMAARDDLPPDAGYENGLTGEPG
ncbi:MAG: ribonuclease HI [Chloroflexi bacterium]|nr:ribonuclease HI [Chloroflexota bacterium]